MAQHTFLGPGNEWVFAPGKVARLGESVNLTKEQEDRARVAGISLGSASDNLRELRQAAPAGEERGNPVNPQDGKPAVEASATDTAVAVGAATTTKQSAEKK